MIPSQAAALAASWACRRFQCRHEMSVYLKPNGHMDSRGKGVVSALSHVDMVVRVNRFSLAKRSPPVISIARLEMTSLTFMLLDVPDPVWKTSIGNWSASWPVGDLLGSLQEGCDLRRH